MAERAKLAQIRPKVCNSREVSDIGEQTEIEFGIEFGDAETVMADEPAVSEIATEGEMVLEIDPSHGHELADLFLIDGNNIAYKAFYAVPDTLTRPSDGMPTNALYGFTSMLDKVRRDYHPNGIAVAWDTRPQKRLDIMPEYKGHRKETPDMLKQQFPFFESIVSAYGYKNLKSEGHEADDVIATLATRASAEGFRVCIVTNDRDSFQLCDERISIMTTPKGLNDPVIYTPEKVLERYGIGPELVADYLGLKGDPGDGILGVPGIGDKTASLLLQEYGGLEEILAAAARGEIKGKKGENLVEHAAEARRSKVLATVVCDIELNCEISDLMQPPHPHGLRSFLEDWGFVSIAKYHPTNDLPF
jgi:DNA polymerase-1